MNAEYRIEYSIQRAPDAVGDFEEIGFGSSGSEGTIGAALHAVQSYVQNRQWETTRDMPDPGEISDEELR